MTKSSARAMSEPVTSPAAAACASADALARAAAECARQHERLGRCLEVVCSDDELLPGVLTAIEESGFELLEVREDEIWRGVIARRIR